MAAWAARRASDHVRKGREKAYGYATLGVVGFDGRYDYKPVGGVVNLAARLCAKAGSGQVLLDHATYAATSDRFASEHVADLDLKGYGGATPAYALELGLAAGRLPAVHSVNGTVGIRGSENVMRFWELSGPEVEAADAEPWDGPLASAMRPFSTLGLARLFLAGAVLYGLSGLSGIVLVLSAHSGAPHASGLITFLGAALAFAYRSWRCCSPSRPTSCGASPLHRQSFCSWCHRSW